ncbi:MAG TPA: response regulator [Candidatus Solibacter sp.]|nr:response regulator [Candidatus Solibacter sp.]
MTQESELSVLLIEDEPDAARLIQHVLSRGGGAPVSVEWAGDLRTGLARLAEGDFQAVLLDLNLPDSSGFETFACVRERAADKAVIVLTGHDDEELALQTVRAGADEYLIKSDIRDRFLAQRIRYAVERNRLKSQGSDKTVKNGKIFSFIGAKGGVGTSTLVVNLAAALAKAGKTAIAIELVPEFGSFSMLLNRSPSCDISTLLRGAPDTISRETVTSCLEDFGAGFRALYGPQRAEDCRSVSPEQARALLGVVRTLADYTLIDAPSIFAPSIEEVIQRSTLTTLVVERDRMGLHAALAKMPALQAIAARSGAVGAVIVNKTPFIEFLAPSEFGNRLGCTIIGVVPPAPDLQSGGASEALPVLSRPDMPFSESIQDIARRLDSRPAHFPTVDSGTQFAASL